MVQFSASPAATANSTARLFMTGSTPGMPRHMGQTFVFGGAWNRVLQLQNILDAVFSSTWTSIPITASYSISSGP